MIYAKIAIPSDKKNLTPFFAGWKNESGAV